MGNVQASSASPDPMMSTKLVIGDKEDQPPGPPGIPKPTKPDNPGTMEELHRKVQGWSPIYEIKRYKRTSRGD